AASRHRRVLPPPLPRAELNHRRRTRRLRPPPHVDERELHVDGRRQLRLRRLQLLQFDHVARFGPRRARRSLGHEWIVGQLGSCGSCASGWVATHSTYPTHSTHSTYPTHSTHPDPLHPSPPTPPTPTHL